MTENAATLRPGDAVTLHYRMTCGDEVVVDTYDGEPERFVLAQGQLAPQIEMLLIGQQVGDHRVVQMAPGQAFGDRNPALLQEMPRSEFPDSTALAVGMMVEFPLPNGDELFGAIRALGDETVTIDFNHPFAGLPVAFEFTVVAQG